MNKTWRSVALAVVVLLALPAAASAAIRIHKIRYDPPGADYTSNKQLRAEYIVITNPGERGRQLRGWVVRDKDGHRFRFPHYRVPSGGYVKDPYWQRKKPARRPLLASR